MGVSRTSACFVLGMAGRREDDIQEAGAVASDCSVPTSDVHNCGQRPADVHMAGGRPSQGEAESN